MIQLGVPQFYTRPLNGRKGVRLKFRHIQNKTSFIFSDPNITMKSFAVAARA